MGEEVTEGKSVEEEVKGKAEQGNTEKGRKALEQRRVRGAKGMLGTEEQRNMELMELNGKDRKDWLVCLGGKDVKCVK